MKKSKKVLLWSIVPVLGVSSGVAGAVAGTKDQTTSVGTNNVATSSSATTMAARNTSSATNGLKITVQPKDKITFSGEPVSMSTHAVSTVTSNIKYIWKINKGDGKWVTNTSSTNGHTFVDVPETNVLLNWKLKCEIEARGVNSKITTDEVILTIAPQVGRNIRVTKQPIENKVVSSGEKVTLSTEAQGVGIYSNKKIGYQWFEYNSSSQEFVEIEGANESSYTFDAPNYTTTQTKKYICRYYISENGKSKEYLSQSSQSIVTINKSVKEVIKINELITTKKELNVGDTTTLSVNATSNITKNLTYQWYKVGSDDRTFEEIPGATEATYKYTASKEDDNKALLFCVLVTGSIQDGVKNHFQSANLEVKVGLSSETAGSVDYDALAKELNVTSSVTTNQASVRSNFYLNKGIKSPEYTVSTSGVEGLTYQWYYVSRNGKENLIDGANTNVFKPTTDLLKKVYNDNSNHKVDIVCKILKNGEVIKTIDKTTNSRFYLGVVINNRRVSNI